VRALRHAQAIADLEFLEADYTHHRRRRSALLLPSKDGGDHRGGGRDPPLLACTSPESKSGGVSR
jgi:hypothetical protein